MPNQSQLALQVLTGLGWSPVQASGIVGNLMQESGPNLQTNLTHDGGTGYGIAGWRDPSPGAGRKTDLFNYASSNGLNVDDLNTQLKFLDHELRTSEGRVGKSLAAATTPEDAARAFINFERPQGWTAANPTAGHGWQNRLNNTINLAGMFGNQSAAPQQATPPQQQPEAPLGGPSGAPGGAPNMPASPRANAGLAGMFAADPIGSILDSGLGYLASQQQAQQKAAAANQARRAALLGGR